MLEHARVIFLSLDENTGTAVINRLHPIWQTSLPI